MILRPFRGQYATENNHKLIFAQLNINLIRNKFELVAQQIKGNIDVLMISETKTEDSFRVGYFLRESFSPSYRVDRDSHGGSNIFIRQDISSNSLKIDKKPVESLTKWT